MPTSDALLMPNSRRHSTRYAVSLISRSPRISSIAFLSTLLIFVGFYPLPPLGYLPSDTGRYGSCGWGPRPIHSCDDTREDDVVST
jgi:hypothetical protein